MPSNKMRVRRALQRACSRYLWCCVPIVLEDYIVAFASSALDDVDVCDSSHGMLFRIAANCAHWYHAGLLDLAIFDPYSQGLFDIPDDTTVTAGTVYDAVITISFDDLSYLMRSEEMDDAEFDRWCKEGYFIL